jgi:hypothetical protein
MPGSARSFAFTTFNAPGAESGSTFVDGLNNRGEAVGQYEDSSGGQTYIRDNRTFTTLTAPSAISIDAEAINSRGEVAGRWLGSDNRTSR